MRALHFAAALLCIVIHVAAFSAASAAHIKLNIDASEAPRKIIHVKLSLPAMPGKMRLDYPKWIPADHRPLGPIADLTGLRFTAGGVSLAWRRDAVDMHAFEVEVPATMKQIEAEFDLVGPVDGELFHLGLSTTSQLIVLNWYQVVLYPEGQNPDNLSFIPSLRLPQDWKFGTALPIDTEKQGLVNFQPVTLTTLVDSPVIAGNHFREIDITPRGETRRHFLDIAADSEAALLIPAETFAHYRRLVSESGALFGARHYNDYHFLVALSGNLSGGDEHHQSSDNRLPEMGMADPELQMLHGTLLAHEMTHSWNGKFWRPKGLDTPDYQQPMKGDLLWVYEGLSNYLGRVLATRSGLLTQEQCRSKIAELSARLTRPGRTWRPLSDTAIAAQLLYTSPAQWQSWRREVDFYDEGTLIWLEVDSIIREQTRGSKSLDDFCKRFAGGHSGPPAVVTYTFDDVVSGLNAVLLYDWAKFLTERLSTLNPQPPLGGIERSGWRLVFSEQPSALRRTEEFFSKEVDMRYSIGTIIDSEGEFIDVVVGTPAAQAGAAPGMKLIAVNSRKYTPDVLRQELRLGKNTSSRLDLLVANGQYFTILHVNYHDGERSPHLERDTSRPDLLDAIFSPRAPIE